MRSLTNIRERLTNMESKTTEAFTEICDVYKTYLNQLEQAVKQQLVFAVHHIATQVYPEIFLALSFSDREKFQKKLRHINRTFHPQLITLLANQGIHIEVTLPTTTDPENPSSDSSLSEEKLLSQTTFNVQNPEDLIQWCRRLEQSIHRLLDLMSQETNKLLQSVEIVNNKLPSQLLEMALHAEENGINIGRTGAPNILNLVVEARQERPSSDDDSDSEEDDDDAEDEDEDERPDNSHIMKITAIHLRLAEIEFSDPNLSVSRKQLRYLSDQINKLHKQYRALKRENLKSEAELAWKSSWMED